ncbi:MAG: DUF2312 domain-containing protein [Bdellovibrionales bacterium]
MPDGTAAVTGARLKQYIERIEKLEEEKQAFAVDIREVFSEAKSAGFDTKCMRTIIKLRKMPDQQRNEQDELLELYKAAIGME